MPYPITGFAPDANPLAVDRGILLDADGIYPTDNGGIAPLPSPVSTGLPLDERCIGLHQHRFLGTNHYRLFAATSSKIYEYTPGGWINISRPSGYAGTYGYRWNFVSWGDDVVATNFSDPIQLNTGGGFGDVGENAPRAKYIVVAKDFLVLAYTYDDEYGLSTSRVWWSAPLVYDWQPSLSTQAGYYELYSTPGHITGLANLGDDFLVFKENAFYIASYVGPPFVWHFRLVSDRVGIRDQGCVVSTESGVFFIGPDGFYHFDGASLHRQSGHVVWHWFRKNLNDVTAGNIVTCVDPIRHLIFIFFPSTGSTLPDDCLIYHYPSGNWGRWKYGVTAAIDLVHTNVSYDTIQDYFETYDSITNSGITYSDPWWSAKIHTMALFNNENQMQYMTGPPVDSYFQTGFIGMPESIEKYYRVWPLFKTYPKYCIITPKMLKYMCDTGVEEGVAAPLVEGKADILGSGRYMGLRYDLSGNYEIFGYDFVSDTISQR